MAHGEDRIARPDDWGRYAVTPDDVVLLTTRKERVAYILNRYPETRNSDKELFLRYLAVFHDLDPRATFLEVVGRGDLPAQTVIARARAELQNKYRLYLPTRPEVVIQRQGRERAYQRVFQHLDEEEVDEGRELTFYSDESGITGGYLIYGFLTFLHGYDAFLFNLRVMEGRREGEKAPHFHFRGVRASQVAAYEQFFQLGVDLPSARLQVHIFDRARLPGPQAQVLLGSLAAAAMATIRSLQASGVIDAGLRITFLPDRSQDQLFYLSLAEALEPPLVTRGFRFGGITPQGSRSSYPVQLADIVTSSFGRQLNNPGDSPKDDLAGRVLAHWRVEDPLMSSDYGNLTVAYHGIGTAAPEGRA